MRAIKRRTLDADAPADAAAIDAFVRLGDIASKLALARELAQTRAAELTRAHPNLTMVLAGFRGRRAADGHQWRYDEPCVVLVVGRKWAKGPAPVGRIPLPEHLVTHIGTFGRRVAVAVPTDVVEADTLLGARTRAQDTVVFRDGGFGATNGSVACEVSTDPRSAVAADRRWVLSALHVFSPFAADTAPDTELDFDGPGHGRQAIGRTLKAGGTLARQAPWALDVQLAQVGPAAFGWLAPQGPARELDPAQPFARDHADIDRQSQRLFRIVVAQDHPPVNGPRIIVASFYGWDDGQVPIVYGLRSPSGDLKRVWRFHRELLLLEIAAGSGPMRPRHGDSGSPVLIASASEKLMLAGMFIGSHDRDDGSTLCCVLPAWSLFGLDGWARPPAGVRSIVPVRTPA